jgi:DNA polymerase-1
MHIEIETIDSLEEISIKEFNVHEINQIKVLYKDIRDRSKTPTFLLTYMGTKFGLEKAGFSAEESASIEEAFHTMYVDSKEWTNQVLIKAAKVGYVELAFGLRLRTPLLAKSVMNSSYTMYEATQEARTAANAASGQSYGLLNNRAAIAFMKTVRQSKWKYDIKPIALIHDAIYLTITDDLECLEWVNNNLIKEMSLQDLPELKHDIVKLGAELDVFYNGWNQPITIENYITQQEISDNIKKGVTKYSI